jgi:hypothetical protein
MEHRCKMRITRIVAVLFSGAATAALFVGLSAAQAPMPGPAPAAGKGNAASAMPVQANLSQLMKGILYPSSNVIFAAQSTNPADVPQAKDPATATDPLTSSYGKWQAVENSGLAIAEAADLLMIPGRKCSNGRNVPVRNADWAKLVQGLRDAGMTSYKAAQAKDQDKILDAADAITTACANCHDKYREKPNLADRCM